MQDAIKNILYGNTLTKIECEIIFITNIHGKINFTLSLFIFIVDIIENIFFEEYSGLSPRPRIRHDMMDASKQKCTPTSR
jgi:hypothetical protein